MVAVWISLERRLDVIHLANHRNGDGSEMENDSIWGISKDCFGQEVRVGKKRSGNAKS
jgi:hypothetical protein